MPTDERVLGIPAAHLTTWGTFLGLRAATPADRARLLDPAHFEFRPRRECETDPSFVQLIPYVVLTCLGRVFHYRRGDAGTETRLQSLRSIGIGGHISEADAAGGSDPYETGLQREVAEEVAVGAARVERFLGFLRDDRTPVGEVHLGVVHQWELTAEAAEPRESALAGAGWADITACAAESSGFETWSQFVLAALGVRRTAVTREPLYRQDACE
jgi:predicted NUDIX family phosphoesterase